MGITLVSLTDTIATATSFAARRGDEVDPDQEMVGIGTSNIAAGFLQGFAVSVSGSRTAVADQSGSKTQMTGLVGAALVAVLLLFLNGLLADLPQTALAAVVIVAALSLMDLKALRHFAEVRPSSFIVSLVAMSGVILLGVLQGIVVAIVLIVLLYFRRGWWPHGAVLGAVPALGGWHSTARYPEAIELPGIIVYRWEAPLFFANSGQFRDQIRRLVRERNPAWIVLQCEAITDIDVTAAEMLKVLDEELNDRGIHIAFVELRDRLQELIGVMTCTPPSTRSTSTQALTWHSMRSTMWPGTTLGRSTKGGAMEKKVKKSKKSRELKAGEVLTGPDRSPRSGIQEFDAEMSSRPKMKKKEYEVEMRRLQGELVAMQQWVKSSEQRSSWCSRDGIPPARAAPFGASPSGRTLECSATWPSPPRANA